MCEIEVGSAEKCAGLLDEALASRSCSGDEQNTADKRRRSHLVFTLNIYNKSSQGNTMHNFLYVV